MQRSFVIVLFVFLCSLISCKRNEIAPCQFRLNQLLIGDTSKITVTYEGDTIVQVRDKSANNFGGIYRFDQHKNLRFYGFFIDSNKYYYSEVFDSKGNLLEKEGVPLVAFEVFKKGRDTVLFVGSLFSLNKSYDSLEIITNRNDTIRPEFLYKSDFYSNTKEFYVKLSSLTSLKELIFFVRGAVINTCTGQEEIFRDTVSFEDTRVL
ncbi:MAG TPA: hypothetical protein VGO58_09170 [Chitinophagaceae bacterium]|jgi:hypothetical protein|nr:hypothetical protein [Chitinophagaceae bacterium]